MNKIENKALFLALAGSAFLLLGAASYILLGIS